VAVGTVQECDAESIVKGCRLGRVGREEHQPLCEPLDGPVQVRMVAQTLILIDQAATQVQ
jgi:hypothetical protein